MKNTALILTVCLIGLFALVIWTIRANERQRPSVDKLHEFCLGVKEAMREDARDFSSGSFQKQEVAFERFYDSQVIYHGTQSIAMCTEMLPPKPFECTANRDWKCLADIARAIENSLPSN